MKLLIQGERIVATATDDYIGPDTYITAPDDYDPVRSYRVIGGVLTAHVPQVVTMRQARLALLKAGLLDDICTAIANSGDRALQIEWEFAQVVDRTSPWVHSLALALNLTDVELDGLFAEAAKL